jgi:predicted ATPase/class 3 adenylate cyclase
MNRRVQAPRDLPSGLVTFLFTDIEGSTRLLGELGADGYAEALAEHRRLIRETCTANGGVEVDTQGDAFFVAFPTASGALAAAGAISEGLASGPIRVRIGIHTGSPTLTPEGYVGTDVHRAARIAAAGHGGQVLLSGETRALVDGDTELIDLGEHRLKDFAEPVWIFQLGSERFPPLRTISNTNLPRPASSFVGRETEVSEVAALLQDGARLLTLTGPGGSGKTRLAIEAASTLVPSFRAGVFWVGLAPLRDPALVAETIGQTIGAKDGLVDHIGERELLLLLDNLEQVITAAPDLASLVETCPKLRLLVTSRERLRVRGEHEYPVSPLADQDAVALFCERSGLPPSDEIASLCRALDELPLAIELAAARASVLTPAQISERLSQRLDLLKGGRDADPRQATLRATIEWSYELLTPDEQRLFGRLAVFRGGATLEAAEAVADADLDTLSSLVDKSLLRHVDGRFVMLETIREYAAQRLEASGEADDIRRRHADYFLALAEEAEPHVEKNSTEWLPRLEGELDNIRAALDRLTTSGETQQALRLTGALTMFWETGHLNEGRERLENLLARDYRPTAPRAKALNGAALIARQSADTDLARARAVEALALNRTLGNLSGAAVATAVLGLVLADVRDFSGGRDHFEDSARLFREAGDEDNALFAARLLAWMYDELGDRERAIAMNRDNLSRARSLGNKAIEGQTLGALAWFALDQGRFQDAISMYKDVLRIDRDLGMALQTAIDICRFARALALAGMAYADAGRLLACAEAIREEIGAGTPPYVAEIIEQTLGVIRTHVDAPAFDAAWQQGRALTADEGIALAVAAPEPRLSVSE